MTRRGRPPHADPFIWAHVHARDPISHWVAVSPGSYDRHPIAHRVEDFTPLVLATVNGRHWSKTACGIEFKSHWDALVRTRQAAQFALPCKRCWPDATPETTTARRYGKDPS